MQKGDIEKYSSAVNKSLKHAVYSVHGEPRPASADIALKEIICILDDAKFLDKKIMFIGNGGSAAIAGHMAADYSNAGKFKAVCFNDGALLTCLANDYGFENVFARAIDMHAQQGDVLIAISSSGKSADILNGVKKAKEKQCAVITLSGFTADNPLSNSGDVNIYVPSASYGIVEVSHYFILHCILDHIASKLKKPA